jgi:hypothetical protein
LYDGAKRDVKKPELKHKQEWDRQELPVLNRVPDKVAKVNGKKHLSRRQY